MPEVRMVMDFKKPESITALVHSLIELQQEMMKANPQITIKRTNYEERRI